MKLCKRKYLCHSAKLTRIYATDDDDCEMVIHEKVTGGVIKDRIELSEKEEKVFVMKMYAIYAGIGNGFGGETFRCFALHENVDDALDYARELAIEDYESYDSTHGLLSKEECEEEGIEYIDEVESWIQYSADLVHYEDIISISEEECLDLDCICDALNKLNLCIKIKKAMEAR